MRCVVCNTILTPNEEIHKDASGAYTDTCFTCLYGDSPGEDDSIWDTDFEDDIAQADLFMDR
jgi:hypothetical protein